MYCDPSLIRATTPTNCRIILLSQESELERLSGAREAETKFVREQNDLEIAKARDMATIETHKFKDMVDAIGSQTIQAIATAGPEMQVFNSTRVYIHLNLPLQLPYFTLA